MQSRHGFTLIELLVVISIIVILIAILLPTLGAAKASARISQCLSNQSQFGKAVFSFAVDNSEQLPAMESWYTLAGPAGTPNALTGISPDILSTGLRSEVGANGVIAARPLNEYLGDNAQASLCPDDQGDSFVADVQQSYVAYGTSYMPHWKDLATVEYFGVVRVFGASTLDASGNRRIIADRKPSRINEAINNNGQTYDFSWSKKILMGDMNWHGNRSLGNPKNLWHSKTERASVMLFGDGHAEFLRFPETYGPINNPVDPATNGFW